MQSPTRNLQSAQGRQSALGRQSPVKRIQEIHDNKLLMKIEQAVNVPNPFNVDAVKREITQSPQKMQQNKPQTIQKSKISAYLNTRGAQINFDDFFALTGVQNPPYSQTVVAQLPKPRPLEDIYKIYEDKTEEEDEKDPKVFITQLDYADQKRFHQELISTKVTSLEERLKKQKQSDQDLFELKKQHEELNNSYDRLTNQKKQYETDVSQLQLEQKKLLETYENQHKVLQTMQLKLQRYQDLVPLFQSLRTHFPQLQPQDAIKKINKLTILNNLQAEECEREEKVLKQLEEKSRAEQIDFVKTQYEQTSQQHGELQNLMQTNEQLQQDMRRVTFMIQTAQNMQTRYLQVCQDITSFWMGLSKLYGNEFMTTLRPSLNDPIQVLRSIDTMLTVIFPDSPRSQKNMNRINAIATTLWQTFLFDCVDADRLRGDPLACLARSMQLYNNKKNELQQIDEKTTKHKRNYSYLREQISDKIADCKKMVTQLREKGYQVQVPDVVSYWKK